MADVEIEDRGIALLPGVHRVVRTLEPTEGPFAGTLVTRGDAVAVRVDAVSLAGWAGWRFAGAEHVAGPVDVIRRADGHDVLLPWCTDRVLGFLVRRTAADSALSSGECSTLVVSMLRGLDELGESADAVQTGVWWLTDGGRPTFVIGHGEDPRAGAGEIIERLRGDCTDKATGRVLTTIREGLVKALAQPRVPRRSLEEWESEVLAIAAPQPLRRELHPPERARDVARVLAPEAGRSLQTRAARRDHRVRAASRNDRTAVVTRIRRLPSALEVLRARLSARSRTKATARTDSGKSAHGDAKPARRRPLLIFAGAAAAVVLVGGLLWPSGDSAESADGAGGGAPSTESSHADSAPQVDSDAESADPEQNTVMPVTPSESDGPASAAAALLTIIAECRAVEDQVCAEAVASGSTGVVELLAPAAEGTPAFELVDEYGDVAVIRLTTAGTLPGEEGEAQPAAPDQMLVLVRQNDKWLVRDVYGVADQPG